MRHEIGEETVGYTVAPDHTRREVRDKLGEGYLDGFPILKELFQNADDARARRLAVILSDGDLGARCREDRGDGIPGFLRGPSVLVVNDGPFEAEHARAIHEYRGSDKSGSSTAVGRFGLGLKSVFHWGEELVHVHLSGETDGGSVSDAAIQPEGLIIPGAPAFGRAQAAQWAKRRPEALAAFVRGRIRELHPNWGWEAPALCFWIPLRGKESHGPHRLTPECKGDDLSKFGQELAGYWDRFWSLLAGAAHVCSAELLLPGVRRVAIVEGTAQRLWRSAEPALGSGHSESGSSAVVRLLVDARPMMVTAAQSRVPGGSAWRAYSDWPVKEAKSDEETPQPLEIEPSAAAQVVGPATLEGSGPHPTVAADWACWFPLTGDNDQRAADIRLVLHAAFLVDSTRKRFETSAPGTAGEKLGGLTGWNLDLAVRGAAPNVPEALEAYVRAAGVCEIGRQRALTSAVRRALETLDNPAAMKLSGFPEALASRSIWGQFVDAAAPDGLSFRCVPASTLILEVPLDGNPSAKEYLDALPGLVQLATRPGTALYWGRSTGDQCDHLGNFAPCAWSEETIAALIEGAAASSLPLITRVLKGMPRAALENLATESPARRSLERLVRDAVHGGATGPSVLAFARVLPGPWIHRLPDGLPRGLSTALIERYQAGLLMWPDPPGPLGQRSFQPVPPAHQPQADAVVRIALDWFDAETDAKSGLDDGLLPLIEWLGLRKCERSEIARPFDGRFPVIRFDQQGRPNRVPRVAEPVRGHFVVDTREPGEAAEARARHTISHCRALATAIEDDVGLVPRAIGALAGWTTVPDWSLGTFLSVICDMRVVLSAAPERRVPLLGLLIRHVEENPTAPNLIDAARRVVSGRDDLERDQPILIAPTNGNANDVLQHLAQELRAIVAAPLADELPPRVRRAIGLNELSADGLVWFIIHRTRPESLRDLPFSKLKVQDQQTLLAGLAEQKAVEHFRGVPLHRRAGSRRQDRLEPLERGGLVVAAPDAIALLLPSDLNRAPLYVSAGGEVGRYQCEVAAGEPDSEALVAWVTARDARGAVDRVEQRKLIFWLIESHNELEHLPVIAELDWLDDEHGRPIRPREVIDPGDEYGPLGRCLDGHPAQKRVRRPGKDDLERGRKLEIWPCGSAAVVRLARLSELPPLGLLHEVSWNKWGEAIPANPKDTTLRFLRAVGGIDPEWAVQTARALDGPMPVERVSSLLRELTAGAGGEGEVGIPLAIEVVLGRLLPELGGPDNRMLLKGIRLPTRADSLKPAELLTFSDRMGAVPPEHNLREEIASLLDLNADDFEPDRDLQERVVAFEELFRTVGGDSRTPQLVALLALVVGRRSLAERELGRMGYDPSHLVGALYAEACNQKRDFAFGVEPRVRAVQALNGVLSLGQHVTSDAIAHNHAKSLAYQASFGPFLPMRHLLTEFAIAEVLRGVKPKDEATRVAVFALLNICKEAYPVPELAGETTLKERLPAGGEKLFRSLCGDIIQLGSGKRGALRGQSLCIAAPRVGELVFLRIDPNLNAETVVETLKRTIEDVAMKRLGCLPSTLARAIDGIANSGRNYIVNVRREVLSNKIGWQKVDVPAVQEAAARCLEASSQGLDEARQRQLGDSLAKEIENHGADLARALGRQMEQTGYSPQVVLFELFQNADDAIIQRVEGLGLPAGDRCVLDLIDDSRVDFLHWGRQLGETHGIGGKVAPTGWANDLVLMLDTMATGKCTHAVGETGAFGLGFKSVFTLTDQPIIAGGRFPPFEVVGGRVPRLLESQSKTALEVSQLVSAAMEVGWPPPTVVRLPYRDGRAPTGWFVPFASLVRIALVFARGVRTVEIRSKDGQVRIEAGLQRCGVPGANLLTPVSRTDGRSARGLVFGESPETRAVLLLDERGAAAPKRDDDFPTIWSLAPTKVELSLPLLLQSRQWALEPGRTALRLDSTAQGPAVEQLRAVLGQGFVSLASVQPRWNLVRPELGLGGNVAFPDFAASIWRALQRTIEWVREGDGSAERAVAHILWDESPAGALRQFADAAGLPDSLREPAHMVRLEAIGAIRAGDLAQRGLFAALAPIHGRAAEGALDSSVKQVAAALGKEALPELTLNSVLREWIAQSGGKCTPVVAETWGSAGCPWRAEKPSEDTRAALDHLCTVHFVDHKGTWRSVGDFVASGATLSDSYTEAGRDFFKVCVWQAMAKRTDDQYKNPVVSSVTENRIVPRITQEDYLRALADCWDRELGLQHKADGLDGLYEAVGIPRTQIVTRLGNSEDPRFEETWFRLLCGLSVQAVLGTWSRHITYLKKLQDAGDLLGWTFNERLTDVLSETLIDWTAGPVNDGDWTLHHRFLVDFDKFRRLVRQHDYGHRLLKAARHDARSRHFNQLAHAGHEPETKRAHAARASLKHFAALLGRELWRLRIADGKGLGDTAFFLSRHSFKTCAVFGLVSEGEKNPREVAERLQLSEDVVVAIRSHPNKAVVTTLDRWRDAPFLAFSTDRGFRDKVEKAIRSEKPAELHVDRERTIDALFDQIERGEEPS